MSGCKIRFCPQCGAEGIAIQQITRNEIVELYCPQCGGTAVLVWRPPEIVGTSAPRDPDSNFEAW